MEYFALRCARQISNPILVRSQFYAGARSPLVDAMANVYTLGNIRTSQKKGYLHYISFTLVELPTVIQKLIVII